MQIWRLSLIFSSLNLFSKGKPKKKEKRAKKKLVGTNLLAKRIWKSTEKLGGERRKKIIKSTGSDLSIQLLEFSWRKNPTYWVLIRSSREAREEKKVIYITLYPWRKSVLLFIIFFHFCLVSFWMDYNFGFIYVLQPNRLTVYTTFACYFILHTEEN